MIDDYSALLLPILEDPGDDLPRLVFADYLEENDGMAACGCTSRFQKSCPDCNWSGLVPSFWARHAEFIRWQIYNPTHSTSFGYANSGRGILGGLHGDTLMRGSGHRWLGDFYRSAGGREWMWSRGMPCDVRMPYEPFFQEAKSLFERYPIERVELTNIIDIRDYGGGDCRTTIYRLGLPDWFWLEMFPDSGDLDNFAEIPNGFGIEGLVSRICVSHGRSLAGLPAIETLAETGTCPGG